MLLVAAFGLFWLAVAAIFRAWHLGTPPIAAVEQAFGFPVGQPAANGLAAAGARSAAQPPQLSNAPPTLVPHTMGSPVRTRVTYVVEEVYQQWW